MYTAAQWNAWENSEEGAGEEDNPAYPGPPVLDALGKGGKGTYGKGMPPTKGKERARTRASGGKETQAPAKVHG